jgi:hypothetical protein
MVVFVVHKAAFAMSPHERMFPEAGKERVLVVTGVLYKEDDVSFIGIFRQVVPLSESRKRKKCLNRLRV